MKKAANKGTVRPVFAVLASVCFFCAAVFVFLQWSQNTYGGSPDDEANRNRVFDALCAQYGELIRESLKEYYDAGNAAESPYCPDLLAADWGAGMLEARPRSNLLFRVEVQENAGDQNKRILFSNNFNDESLAPEYAYYFNPREDAESGNEYVITHNPWLSDTLGQNSDRHTVQIEYVIRHEDLTAKDGFYYAREYMQMGEQMQNIFRFEVILFASLTVLFCVLYLLSALREGSRQRGRPRLFRELTPDLLLVVLFPMAVCCVKELFGWDKTKIRDEWIQFFMHGASSPRLLLPMICGTAIFTAALVWTAVALFSLRRYGLRGMLAYTRYEKAPFTYKTIPALLILQSVKAASILLYAQTFSNMAVYLLLEKAALVPVLYRCLREIHLVASKTEVYTQGDLSHRIAGNTLYRSLNAHAADIDSIAQRIRMSADEYIRSGQFKAELITNLSHDIKTPLTSIINYAALLQDPELSAADRARYLEVLARHSARMSRLVEDLTQVADAQKGKIEVHAEMMDLSSLVVQSALGFEERLQNREIKIRFHIPDDPVFVCADPRLMVRVADNLMNNICKYAAGSSEIRIGVVEQDGEAAAFYINKPDKPLEVSGDALMERFVRADSSRHTEGSGLGLSIARSIMRVQGGELRIETTPDRFTAYVFFGGIDGKEA